MDVSSILNSSISYMDLLSDKIKESITWYTHSEGYYQEFNYRLRNNLELTTVQKYHLENLLNAFEDAPKLSYPLVVYRGVEDENFDYSKQFISTSLNKDTAETFSTQECCIYVITILPGVKILPVYLISNRVDEDEILINRGVKLNIVSEEKRNKKKYIFMSVSPEETLSISSSSNNSNLIIQSLYKTIYDLLKNDEFLDKDLIELSVDAYTSHFDITTKQKKLLIDILNYDLLYK